MFDDQWQKCAESNTHLFELSYYLAWWFDCILLSFSSLKIYIIDSHFQENSGQLYLYMSSLDYTFCTCESAGVFLGPNDINFIMHKMVGGPPHACQFLCGHRLVHWGFTFHCNSYVCTPGRGLLVDVKENVKIIATAVSPVFHVCFCYRV